MFLNVVLEVVILLTASYFRNKSWETLTYVGSSVRD